MTKVTCCWDTELTPGTFVEFSQHNGIVCYGEVLATVAWEQDVNAVLVKYYWDPVGDPPRRAYSLVHASEVRKSRRKPHYVTATHFA